MALDDEKGLDYKKSAKGINNLGKINKLQTEIKELLIKIKDAKQNPGDIILSLDDIFIEQLKDKIEELQKLGINTSIYEINFLKNHIEEIIQKINSDKSFDDMIIIKYLEKNIKKLQKLGENTLKYEEQISELKKKIYINVVKKYTDNQTNYSESYFKNIIKPIIKKLKEL